MQYFAPVNMYYFIFGLMTIFIEKQQNTIKIVWYRMQGVNNGLN